MIFRCNPQNIFVHFEPVGPKDEPLEHYDPDLDLPPYLIPDGNWHTQWKKEHKKGWYDETFNAHKAAEIGDMLILETIAEEYPDDLEEKDSNGWQPIHLAVRGGHFDAVDLMIDYDVDINSLTNAGDSPLTIAKNLLREGHPVTHLLIAHGGFDPIEEEEL